MGFRGVFCALVGFFGVAAGHGDELWLIEQDFVKFGKKEAYEEYKQKLLSNDGKTSIFSFQEVDSPQYVYFIPLEGYSGLGDLPNATGGGNADLVVPYLSTLNFTIESLHAFLPDCSSVPKGKESLLTFGAAYFYLFGVTPGNEGNFEDQIKGVARKQRGKSQPVSFRTWKVLIGADTPKYLIVVFGDNKEDAENRAEGLSFINGPIKNILRSEKKGAALLRKDLSQ